MSEDGYLRWLANETPTTWWNDSGDPDELEKALEHGATGVTTNPILTFKTLRSSPERWGGVERDLKKNLIPQERAERLTGAVVRNAAAMLEPVYRRTAGKLGYVCAQVNPTLAADAELMIRMAERFHAWAPNIAVKLPVTAAGLDALEECAARGMTVTATVSFTVPQVIAVAERFRNGLARARSAGKAPGRCFAVIMIGRLDDYLADVAKDRKAGVDASDVRQAGLAVTKRAYSLFKEHDFEAVLLVAALRGTHHLVEFTGADLIVSIHPKFQAMFLEPGLPREPHQIDVPVPSGVIQRLRTIPEFIRAYEPDGMRPAEFLTFGLTQRTLSQFISAGWSLLEDFHL